MTCRRPWIHGLGLDFLAQESDEMSWETKPLLLKNGLPIPQQFDPALDEWVEYTNEDIKALKTDLTLVKTELQTIKTNQLSGDQKVKLSGAIPTRKFHQVVNAGNDYSWVGETRGTSASARILDVSSYNELVIVTINNSPEAITLSSLEIYDVPEGTRGEHEPIDLVFPTGDGLEIPSGASITLRPSKEPILAEPIIGLVIRYSGLQSDGEITVKFLWR